MKKINIDLHNDHCNKNSKCRYFAMMFMVKNYIFTDDKNENFYNDVYVEWHNKPNYPVHFISFSDKPSRYPSSVIDFDKYDNFDKYYKNLSSSVKRDYTIAEKKRYIFEEFEYDNFIPDISELNKSNLKRKNKL